MEVSDRGLWATAVTTYVIGDIATTASGFNVMNVEEAHPVSSMVLDSYGIQEVK